MGKILVTIKSRELKFIGTHQTLVKCRTAACAFWEEIQTEIASTEVLNLFFLIHIISRCRQLVLGISSAVLLLLNLLLYFSIELLQLLELGNDGVMPFFDIVDLRGFWQRSCFTLSFVGSGASLKGETKGFSGVMLGGSSTFFGDSLQSLFFRILPGLLWQLFKPTSPQSINSLKSWHDRLASQFLSAFSVFDKLYSHLLFFLLLSIITSPVSSFAAFG